MPVNSGSTWRRLFLWPGLGSLHFTVLLLQRRRLTLGDVFGEPGGWGGEIGGRGKWDFQQT